MFNTDQESRQLAVGKSKQLENYLVYAIDMGNNQRIHRIIDTFGYPTKKNVGTKSLEKFWLSVQHQDFDLVLQEQCLKKCGFAPKQKALLTDRILVNQGKPQIYGTQFYRHSDGKLVTRPIKNFELVEKLRKGVGLESLKSIEKKMNARDKMQKIKWDNGR